MLNRSDSASALATGQNIEITSLTVRPGDVVIIGGRPHEVKDLVTLPGIQRKRLEFRTGETLTMTQGTRLLAVRAYGR